MTDYGIQQKKIPNNSVVFAALRWISYSWEKKTLSLNYSNPYEV